MATSRTAIALQSREQRKAEEQARNEAEAKARTFDIGSLGLPALTSLLTANPAPFLAQLGGEGVRAATGSSTDIGGIAQKALAFLPEPTTEMAKTDLLKQGSQVAQPGVMPSTYGVNSQRLSGNPALQGITQAPDMRQQFSDFVGKVGATVNPLNWTAPETGKEKTARYEKAQKEIGMEKAIKSGGLVASGVSYNGINYRLPTADKKKNFGYTDPEAIKLEGVIKVMKTTNLAKAKQMLADSAKVLDSYNLTNLATRVGLPTQKIKTTKPRVVLNVP